MELLNPRSDIDDAVKPVLRRFPKGVLQAVITNPDADLPEEGFRLDPWDSSM